MYGCALIISIFLTRFVYSTSFQDIGRQIKMAEYMHYLM
jgi:hypothetical protein